jgi:hypothetical protein
MGHSQEEEQELFLITLEYLFNIHYVPVEGDYIFLKEHYTRLVTDKTLQWLNKL